MKVTQTTAASGHFEAKLYHLVSNLIVLISIGFRITYSLIIFLFNFAFASLLEIRQKAITNYHSVFRYLKKNLLDLKDISVQLIL